jgi:hypothetical protein
MQITSKLPGTWHSRVEEAVNQTLADLGTDYLDCQYFVFVSDSRLSEVPILVCFPSVSRPLARPSKPQWQSSHVPFAS